MRAVTGVKAPRRGKRVGRRSAAAILSLAALAGGSPAQADIRQYAQDCKDAIGAAVESFDCMDGTVVPMVGTEGGDCEKPPYLPDAGCFKYSRLGQLFTTDDNVGIVFLCRHKHRVADDKFDKFADIAVIQTNFETGATCFYQKVSHEEDLPGKEVPEPNSPEGAAFWMPPEKMKTSDNACVQCHDNGAFLRTPYVKQVEAAVPAFAPGKRNKKSYWFPGNRFLGWNGRVFKLSGSGNCTTCHPMGTSNIDPRVGTATWLGLFSTGKNATPHSQDAQGKTFWMKPTIHDLDEENQRNSELVRDCASNPSPPECTKQLWDGQVEALLRQIEELSRQVAGQR